MTWGTTFLCSMAITTTLLTHRFIIPVFRNVLTIVGNTSLGFIIASALFFTFLGISLRMGLRKSTIKFGFILSVKHVLQAMEQTLRGASDYSKP